MLYCSFDIFYLVWDDFDNKNGKSSDYKIGFLMGLSKKETCLRGRVAVWPFGRNYESFYKPFYKYYNIMILIILLIIANLQGKIV